ncbi:MAG: hypothetical protein ACRD1R_15170 [Acidobacteriota bacterium]
MATDKAFLIIGGERVESACGETCEDLDPSTGEALSVVSKGNADDIDAAVPRPGRPLKMNGPIGRRKIEGGFSTAWAS